MSYFVGFDVVIKNDLGIGHRQPSLTVDVYNVTDSASVGTIDSGDHGVVESQSVAVTAGKVLRFSVSGYAGTIERTAVSALDPENFLGITDLTLLLEDNFTPDPIDPAYHEVWVKTATEANPVKIGTVQTGETLKYPFNPAVDIGVQFFAVAKTDKGAANVFDLQNAVMAEYAPNRETGVADFSQDGAAANTLINFIATGFSPAVSRFRKIQTASDSGFTTDVVTRIDGEVNTNLSPNFSISRSDDLTHTKTVWVQIAHSSNNQSFGAYSSPRSVIFPDDMGAGGSTPGTPPTGLYISQSGFYIYLNWTDGSGTNTVYRNGDSLGAFSGATSDSPPVGWQTYYVSNDDGSTDPQTIYFSGFEV